MTGAELVDKLTDAADILEHSEVGEALQAVREPAGAVIDLAVAGASNEGHDPAELANVATSAVAGVLSAAGQPAAAAIVALFVGLIEKLVLKLSAVTLEADEFEGIADMRT